MLKRFLKNERGLTLIELLAVVVILGIIAAIAVPSIGGIIEKTRIDAQKAEAVQIISAAKMHMAANAFTTDSGSRELTQADLGQYLDNVKDDSYEVLVTKTAGSPKYSYILKDHNYETHLPADVSDKTAGLTEVELGIQ